MATKYVKSIKFTSSGEVYQIRDAEAKQRLDNLVIPSVEGLASEAYVNQAVAPKANASSVYTKEEVNLALNSKQDTLTAGTGINITNNVISATGGGTGAVSSVNGKTGAVVLNASDVGAADAGQMSAHVNDSNIHVSVSDRQTWSGKQDQLVSGSNIKTINNQSILGEGNISIGGSGGTTDYDQLDNRPQVNGTILTGNKTSADLGLQQKIDADNKLDVSLVSGAATSSEVSDKANASDLTAHTNNSDIHVTSADKSAWSSKQDALPSISGQEGKYLKVSDQGSLTWSSAGGGTGGTTDYTELDNKPQVNGETLTGDKSGLSLGLVSVNDLVSENNNTSVKLDLHTESVINLDSIALDGKSYRQIFETLNELQCSAGFVEGTLPSSWYPYSETTPMPEVVSGTETPGSIGQNILKSFSDASQSIRSVQALIPMDNTVPFTRSTMLFQACRAKCTRWVAGVLGISKSNVVDSRSALVGGVTNTDDNNWETVSGVWNYATQTEEPGNLECVGSIKTADLDGYIDLPVVVRTESFTVVPTIEEFTEAYKMYLKLLKDGPIVEHNYQDIVHTSVTTVNQPECYALIDNGTTALPTRVKAKPHYEVNKDIARAAFYAEMNEVAAQLGMVNSQFVSAAGWTSQGTASANITTTNDLARLGMKDLDFPFINTIWNCPTKTIHSTGNRRDIVLNSTVVWHNGWADVQKVDYHLLGGKTGSANSRMNYVITMQAKDTDDVFTVACSATGYSESASRNRHINAKKLADIGKLLRAAGEYAITDSDNIQNAECKAAVKAIEASLFDSGDCANATVLLTPAHPGSYDGIDIYDSENPSSVFLYSHDGTSTFSAASTTKMLTMLVVMNWIPDLHDTMTVTREDWLFGGGQGGSGPEFFGGEVLTYEDLIYALMLPSSNASAEAMARTVGQKIYSSKHRDYDPTRLYLTNAMCGTPANYLGGYESPRTNRLTTASNTEAAGMMLRAGETITFTGLAPTGVDPLKIDYVYATSAGPNPLLSAGAWAQAVSSGRVDAGGTAADGFPLNREGNNTATFTNTTGTDYYYFWDFASATDETNDIPASNYSIKFSIQ